MGGKIQQQQKENLYRGDDDGSVGKKPRVSFVPQPQNQSVGRQQQRPEQQRTFLPRPQRGELVGRGQIAIAVMVDVGDGEIVLEGGGDQDDGRKKHQRKSGNARAARGFAQPFRSRTRHEPKPTLPRGTSTRSRPTRAEAQNCQFGTWKTRSRYFFRNSRRRQPENHGVLIRRTGTALEASTWGQPHSAVWRSEAASLWPQVVCSLSSCARRDSRGRLSPRVPFLNLGALLLVVDESEFPAPRPANLRSRDLACIPAARTVGTREGGFALPDLP